MSPLGWHRVTRSSSTGLCSICSRILHRRSMRARHRFARSSVIGSMYGPDGLWTDNIRTRYIQYRQHTKQTLIQYKVVSSSKSLLRDKRYISEFLEVTEANHINSAENAIPSVTTETTVAACHRSTHCCHRRKHAGKRWGTCGRTCGNIRSTCRRVSCQDVQVLWTLPSGTPLSSSRVPLRTSTQRGKSRLLHDATSDYSKDTDATLWKYSLHVSHIPMSSYHSIQTREETITAPSLKNKKMWV